MTPKLRESCITYHTFHIECVENCSHYLCGAFKHSGNCMVFFEAHQKLINSKLLLNSDSEKKMTLKGPSTGFKEFENIYCHFIIAVYLIHFLVSSLQQLNGWRCQWRSTDRIRLSLTTTIPSHRHLRHPCAPHLCLPPTSVL